MILFVTKSGESLFEEAPRKRKRRTTEIQLNDTDSPMDLLNNDDDDYPGEDDDATAFLDDLADDGYPSDIAELIAGGDLDVTDDEYPGGEEDETDEDYPGEEPTEYPGDDETSDYPGDDNVDDAYPGDDTPDENVDLDNYPGDNQEDYPSDTDQYPGDDSEDVMTGSDAYPGADGNASPYPGVDIDPAAGADTYPGDAAPTTGDNYPGDTPAPAVDANTPDVYPGDIQTPPADATAPTDGYPGGGDITPPATPDATPAADGYPGADTAIPPAVPDAGGDAYPGATDVVAPPVDAGYPGGGDGAVVDPNAGAVQTDANDYTTGADDAVDANGDGVPDAPPADDTAEDQGPGIGYDSMRNYNLYKEYYKLLKAIDTYVEKVNSMTVDDMETNKLMKYCVNKLTETRELCYDYMVIKFEASTYVQNRVFYQTLIVSIQLIFDTISKILEADRAKRDK